jgi:hypothetical protein
MMNDAMTTQPEIATPSRAARVAILGALFPLTTGFFAQSLHSSRAVQVGARKRMNGYPKRQLPAQMPRGSMSAKSGGSFSPDFLPRAIGNKQLRSKRSRSPEVF